MAGIDVNSVALTGNLTRDPELRHFDGGGAVCDMRMAVNGRKKNSAGAWVDHPTYVDVTTFGNHAAACAEWLAKGRPIAVQGRLVFEEWEAKDGSGRRSRLKVIGMVKFLGGKDTGEQGDEAPEPQEESTEVAEPVGAFAGGGEDDIPF